MVGSLYITSAEYSAYGLPAGTTDTQVAAASALVNAFLQRPEGVEVSIDGNGNPAWMTAQQPAYAYKLQDAITAGSNVLVTLIQGSGSTGFGGALQADVIGQPMTIDRGTPSLAESCVVTSVLAAQGSPPPNLLPNQAILLNCQFDHPAGATVETGLTICEERQLPSQRSVTQLLRPGPPRLISGLGRYSYGRRSDQMAGLYSEFNLLATLGAFGGPPQWIPWNVTAADIKWVTGEVWVPAGILRAYYSEVRIFYVAGWRYADIPPAIKYATAQLVAPVNQLGPDGPFSGNVRSFTADQISVTKWTQSNLTPDITAQIRPYRIRPFQ